MLNKILYSLMGIALVVAVVIGLFYRQTYTNMTAERNFMEKYFSVALWDFDMASPDYTQIVQDELTKSNLIIRVRATGQMDFKFKNNVQHVEVLEVYHGNELVAGDKIAITSLSWGVILMI